LDPDHEPKTDNRKPHSVRITANPLILLLMRTTLSQSASANRLKTINLFPLMQ